MRRDRCDWLTGGMALAGVLTASALLATAAPVAASLEVTHGATHLIPVASPGLGLPRASPRAAPLLFTAPAGTQDAAAIEEALGLDQPARRLIQQGLWTEGFDPGPPDGLFGPRTRAATRAWQQAGGHTVTGYLNGAQADELQATGTARPDAQECSPVSADQEWSTLVEALAHAVGAFRAELVQARL